MLLEFIKGLNRDHFSPYLYLFTRGTLVNEVPPDIPYYLPYKQTQGLKNWLVRKTISKKDQNYLTHQLKALQRKHGFALWYINTIAVNPKVYDIAASLGIRVVTHIHELPYAYADYPAANLQSINAYAHTLVGCSEAVCKSLRQIGCKNVALLYNFVDTDRIDMAVRHNTTRKQLQIDDNEFIWLISARTSYWKGLHLLPAILERWPDCPARFVWMGDELDNSLMAYTKLLLDQKFTGKVLFAGAKTEDYYDYYALADGFLCLSLQESFSLVILEAAYLGLPIVTFEYGAAHEVLEGLSAEIVPDYRLTGLILAMQQVMQNKKAAEPRRSRREIPFKKDIQTARFNTLLNELLTDGVF